jgi:hypothetical protein
MSAKMQLTREELIELVHEAVMQDREERDKAGIGSIIDRKDVESPAYNTNQLFMKRWKPLKQRIRDGHDASGYQPPDFNRVVNTYGICDSLRKLVDAAFLVPSNAQIMPGSRHRAIDLYTQIADLWETAFDESISRRIEERQKEVAE